MTAKQKANRERFKKVVAEAKKLRKKNPKLTQAQAVKQAWAIMYAKPGNKVGATKIIQKGESKKAKVTKVLQQTRTKSGQFKGYKRIAGQKTTGKSHSDSKSHNVNIRVMSGVKKEKLEQINFINSHIAKWRKILFLLEDELFYAITSQDKMMIRKDIKEAKYNIKTLEDTLKEFKKLKR